MTPDTAQALCHVTWIGLDIFLLMLVWARAHASARHEALVRRCGGRR